MHKRDLKTLVGWTIFILIFFVTLFIVSRAHGQEVEPVKLTHANWDNDTKSGRWVQYDGFTQAVSYEFRKFVNFLVDNDANTVEIQLSNGGGALFAALSMMDDVRYLQENGILVITRATGLCASACAMLWSQGDIRIVGPNSWLMFHSLAITRSGESHETLSEIVASAAQLERIQSEINANLSIRLNLPPETVTEMMSRDTWITAGQAIEMGIASAPP